ncbi:hypothetical protein PR048_016254 [Dryococelus australis]|uniref:Uncharacterized protein n=1 Tax=Dryococelus australis TaxID=614101 RepID=A0ABQ9HJ76_9NEOP|nr:hypothetical protein PR048_016254 [Dryococelus australis]
MRVNRGECIAAPGCTCWGTGRPPRKPDDQKHRPSRFPHKKNPGVTPSRWEAREIAERGRRLKQKKCRNNTASSRQRTFLQTNTPPESGEEELGIREEEELNYPQQTIRAVVDKEKKKVRSKKDRELKKKDDTIKKLKQKVEKLKKRYNRTNKKEQIKCQKRLQELTPQFKQVIRKVGRKNKVHPRLKGTGQPSLKMTVIPGFFLGRRMSLKVNLADNNENYNCKFAEETRAFHFSGSRKQVSLHTMVTCLQDKNSQIDMPLTIQNFCTLSDCLDHGVHAIWAHLKPILKTFPDYSDSPSTQYQNKKMFTVLSHYFIDMFPNVQHFTWNYHEATHVSQGKDIPDVATLISALKENIDIIIEEVTKDDIDQMKQRLNFKDVKAFIGTMCVHQVCFHMKELSCLACSGECPHYVCGQYPGQLKKKLNVYEVYGTDSDDGDDLNDSVCEEDIRVEYLVRCSKEHDLFKGNPNSVVYKCSVRDIIDILWSYRAMERWSYGAVEQLNDGVWSYGAIERWSYEAMELWSYGTVERWSNEGME